MDYKADKLHEECGVFGVYNVGDRDVRADSYFALFALQHRGQESCGIAVNEDGVIYGKRGNGLVSEVISREFLDALPNGKMAIAHCLYGIRGNFNHNNAQPLVIEHIKGGMAVSNNGSLVNSYELRAELEMRGAIFHTSSDAEVIAYTITRERLESGSIEEAVVKTMDSLRGSYSFCLMSPRKLIAARDPLGIRPLCLGRLGDSYFFASESCALSSIDAEFVRDIEPGEVVVISDEGIKSIRTHCGRKSSSCIFEFIYFARPDSVIDGASVHLARRRAGKFLAIDRPADADVVIGVPDSGIDAAIGYAEQSGLPYGMGFLKNKYIGRTFIENLAGDREIAVKIKLNPISNVVSGKRVLLVDDSIVRGTTIAGIVKRLREAGAKEVHARLSSPPFLYPCYYGTDIKSSEDLIAYKHSMDEIVKILDVDSIGFLGIERLREICVNHSCGICDACFTGVYPGGRPALEQAPKYRKKLIAD